MQGKWKAFERGFIGGLLLFAIPVFWLFDHFAEPILFGIGRTIFDFRGCTPGWVRQNKWNAIKWCFKGPTRYWFRRVFGNDRYCASVGCGTATFLPPARIVKRWTDSMLDRLERRYGMEVHDDGGK